MREKIFNNIHIPIKLPQSIRVCALTKVKIWRKEKDIFHAKSHCFSIVRRLFALGIIVRREFTSKCLHI